FLLCMSRVLRLPQLSTFLPCATLFRSFALLHAEVLEEGSKMAGELIQFPVSDGCAHVFERHAVAEALETVFEKSDQRLVFVKFYFRGNAGRIHPDPGKRFHCSLFVWFRFSKQTIVCLEINSKSGWVLY